jgi:hypothetical protein
MLYAPTWPSLAGHFIDAPRARPDIHAWTSAVPSIGIGSSPCVTISSRPARQRKGKASMSGRLDMERRPARQTRIGKWRRRARLPACSRASSVSSPNGLASRCRMPVNSCSPASAARSSRCRASRPTRRASMRNADLDAGRARPAVRPSPPRHDLHPRLISARHGPEGDVQAVPAIDLHDGERQ